MTDDGESYESYTTPPSSPRKLLPAEVPGFFEQLPDWGLSVRHSCPSPFVIAWLHVLLDDYKTKCQELENALKSAEIQRDEAEARLKLVSKTHVFGIRELDGPFSLCLKACVDQIPFGFPFSSLYITPCGTHTVSFKAPSCVHEVIAKIPEMYEKVRFAFTMIMSKMRKDMDVTDLVSRTVALSLKQDIIQKTTELKKRRDGKDYDFRQLMAKEGRHTLQRQGYLEYLLKEIPLPLNRGSFPRMTSCYSLFWNEYQQRMMDFS